MFCSNPFNRLEIKADGSVYCCCEGWLPKSLGNILTDNLLALWNGHVATEIRASILDGSFRYCTSCPFLPSKGETVVQKTPADLASENRSRNWQALSTDLIQTLKLDYDQSCNLTCPSCRVVHSREFVDLPNIQRIHNATIDSGILKKTKELYVTGSGDPFASELYWEFLRSLPTLKYKTGMTLFLHTNGLLFDSQHWDLLGDTRVLVRGVGISVDAATEPTYKTNRGASWSKLWNNIKFINSLQERGEKITLGMFFTVQANNFKEIIPFVQMAFNHNTSWISLTALRNWGTYSDEEYRTRAVHLPTHPQYAEFKEMVSNPILTDDRRIVLDSFNPEFVRQSITINSKALLPASNLKR